MKRQSDPNPSTIALGVVRVQNTQVSISYNSRANIYLGHEDMGRSPGRSFLANSLTEVFGQIVKAIEPQLRDDHRFGPIIDIQPSPAPCEAWDF